MRWTQSPTTTKLGTSELIWTTTIRNTSTFASLASRWYHRRLTISRNAEHSKCGYDRTASHRGSLHVLYGHTLWCNRNGPQPGADDQSNRTSLGIDLTKNSYFFLRIFKLKLFRRACDANRKKIHSDKVIVVAYGQVELGQSSILSWLWSSVAHIYAKAPNDVCKIQLAVERRLKRFIKLPWTQFYTQINTLTLWFSMWGSRMKVGILPCFISQRPLGFGFGKEIIWINY